MQGSRRLQHGGAAVSRAAGASRLRASAGNRAIALVCGLALATILGLGMAPSAQAAPVQFYYVPFPENDLLTAFRAVANNTTPSSPITSYITITAIGDNTIIYYDQWENGYDIDIANTLNVYTSTYDEGTQIWGDGNSANGAPPGIPSDVINAGTVINLNNTVAVPRNAATICFDGGDKIAATKTVALTRTSWAAGSVTNMAGSVEVFDTNTWGTDFRAPVGTNILPAGTDYQMFEYTALSIMAGEDGATVYIDANADGTDETTVTLAEGGSYFVNGGVSIGARVHSDNPIQVDIFTGDIGSNYESRDSALIPTGTWSNNYYTPVSTPSTSQGSTGTDTTVWLYNPGTSGITVTYERRVGGVLTSSTLDVTAGGYRRQVLPEGTGAHFYTTGAPFYAYSTTDSNNSTYSAQYGYSGNQAWDWSFALVPTNLLTTQALVGLGIGRDPSYTTSTENGNPIWVTPVGNGETVTRVYVDYDADPATGPIVDGTGVSRCDVFYDLKELQQQKVYAPPVPVLAVDASSQGTQTNATSTTLSISHTTGTTADRLMLVGVVIGNEVGAAYNVSSVRYGGVDLTRVGRTAAPAGGGGNPNSLTQVEIWALANPASGNANVVVTLPTARAFTAGVTTFSGVDVTSGLTSALGTSVWASASSGTAQSVDVTTTAGQMVYDVVGACTLAGRNNDPSTFTIGAGQTSRWTQLARSGNSNNTVRRVRGAGSTETATGASTRMSWTSTTSLPWAIGAVPINRAPASYKTDQTGMLLYTLDPAVTLAVAWGQDTLVATAGSPGLDVGTSVPPMPEFTAGKDSALYTDNDTDGHLSAGDEMEYTISVYNVSRLPVPDIVVWDPEPDPDLYDTTYVLESTCVDGVPIDDDGSGSAFPLDGDGYNIGDLLVGESRTVTFRVIIDDYADLIEGAEAIVNEGSATAFGWTDPVDDRAFLRGRISDFVWYDVNYNGIQDAGEGGIAGVTVTLQDGEGNVVYTDEGVPITTVTDDTGLYDFTGLLPGPYVMKFVPPEGSVITLQNQGGDDALDSDPDPTTYLTGVINLGSGQKDSSVDAGIWVDLTSPTAVVVSSFGAYEVEGRVVVGWETASEIGAAGFFVERLAGEGGNWVRASERLVPALLESPSGGSYSLVDEGAQVGETLTYRLVEVEISGATRYYGPYEVTANGSLPWDEAAIGISNGMQSVRIPETAKQEHALDPEPPAEFMIMGRSKTDRMRIEVVESGLYYIAVADIATGLNISDTRARSLIKTKGLKLTTKGSTVAYLGAGDQSAIYFYGQAIDSIYTSNNVYWLTVGKGATMASAKKTSSKVSTVTSFTETLHFEENLVSALAAFHDPQGDFWLWDYVSADEPDPSVIGDISLDAPGALSGGRLDVLLKGLSSSGEADEHHVEVKLNGTSLGEARWANDVAYSASFDIPEGVLQEQDNQFELLVMLDDGIPYSIVGLDSIDLTYERTATVADDQLALGFSTACPVVVDGLSSSDAWVFDVTSPRTPQVVGKSGSGDEGGSAWVKFMAVKNREYLVASVAGAMRPQAITATSAPRAPSATNLGGSAGGAQYVVITTEALSGAAAELAAYRSRGLTTFVTTMDDIYDEFNYGIADPHAIQSFIKNALAKWRIPPSYVVLAGEGSFDYKNYTGNGDSMVPPLMVDGAYGLTPTDVVLADTSKGDGVPEVAIGRLPALDEDGLRAQIDKIRAYEADEGDWRQSVRFAADNGDEGGNFPGISDTLAKSIPSSLTLTKAYVDVVGADATRAALLGAFADGMLLVNYIGHGSESGLADGLLTTDDVASFPESSRLPIVTALTCLTGQYAYPGYDTLSEALMKRAGAGAIAVWSPADMEKEWNSVTLGELFMQEWFGSSHVIVLGDAIRAAQAAGAQHGLPYSVLVTYNLLGDPALQVRW
jgi:hypothetical protein